MPNRVAAIGILLCAACASSSSGGSHDPRPLDEQYPARITLSDSGEYYANAMISITPQASGSPNSGPRVTLQANATNLSRDPTTEAFREGREDMDASYSIDLTAAQARHLAGGDEVAIEGLGLNYGVPGREVARVITTVELSVNSDHTVTLVINFEPGFRATNPENPPTDENLGTAENMVVRGQIVVTCITSTLAGDPNFETEFCRDALDISGLGPVRDAQL